MEIEPESADFASKISNCLDNTMIEARCGDLKMNTRKLCGISTIDAWVDFVRCSIYFSSNNLLSNNQTDSFLKWTLDNGVFWILEELLMLKVPTTEILAPNLLLSAIRQNKFDVVRTILAIGVDINVAAGQGPSQTSLLAAVNNSIKKQDVNILQLLLDTGADPNGKDFVTGKSAINMAISKGSSIKFVRKLIDAGADPNSVLENGRLLAKLLDQAISNKDFQLLRLLLEKKAATVHSTTIRDNMLRKISRSDDIGLIRAVFELSRILTASVNVPENEVNKLELSLERIFKDMMETCSSPEAKLILFEARGIYCSYFPALKSEDAQHVPQNPLLLFPALQRAASENETTYVRELLCAGVPTKEPGTYDETVLNLAVQKGQVKLVSILLENDPDVNNIPCRAPCRTVLQEAAKSGNIDIVRLLLYARAEVNAPAANVFGRTALQAAAEYGKLDIVRLLLDMGAEINAPAAEDCGLTALQAAAGSGKTEILQLLLSAGAEVNAPAGRIDWRMALQAVVEAHNSENVTILLDAGANIDAPRSGDDGVSALHTASQCGVKSCALLQKLLRKVNDISDPREKQAALEWAVHHGVTGLVKYLLDSGTDPNMAGKVLFSTSALEEAVQAKNLEIAALLMSSGADPNKSKGNWQNQTPLQLAIRGKDVDMVNLLIARGVALSYWGPDCDHFRGAKRFSFLNLAISTSNASIEIFQALIDAGAKVDGEDPSVSTPLQEASKFGKIELVKILLRNGANINAPPVAQGGSTALQAAVKAQNLQLVRFLLQNGADVNVPAAKIRGATALQRAAMVGHLRITLVLLEAGADINAPEAEEGGRTALDTAAEHGRLDILYLLLNNDTEKDTLAARCEQAAKLATGNGRLVIARILRGYVQS